MVSTRGLKPKYEIGERVLCYEPDPKKMKMLYDAKVLGNRPSEKTEGRRGTGFDYYVHFLGWSSTWDRYVADDMLMKDNDEGRREQNHLHQLLQNSRAEKKKKRKSTDRIRASTDSNPSPVPSETSPESKNKRLSEESSVTKDNDSDKHELKPKRMRLPERLKIDEFHQEIPKKEPTPEKILERVVAPPPPPPLLPPAPASKEEESGVKFAMMMESTAEELKSGGVEEDVCTEPITIQFPDPLKRGLEKDLKYVSGGKVSKLPAQPNIVTLLENYVRKYATNKLSAVEKQIQKNHNPYRQDKDENQYFDDVRVSINLCKEVAEGFRILIDFLLGDVLLYAQERGQFTRADNIRPHMESMERLMADVSHFNQSTTSSSGVGNSGTNKPKKDSSLEEKLKRRLSKRKETESDQPGSSGSVSSSGGTETPTLSTISSTTTPQQYPQFKQSHQILRELEGWKLLPEAVYFERPAPLSLIYGGVHLARFAVKLPEMFVRMRFPNKKVKLLSRFVEFLVDFVAAQADDFFADSIYVQQAGGGGSGNSKR